jgi:hypothetical protein
VIEVGLEDGAVDGCDTGASVNSTGASVRSPEPSSSSSSNGDGVVGDKVALSVSPIQFGVLHADGQVARTYSPKLLSTTQSSSIAGSAAQSGESIQSALGVSVGAGLGGLVGTAVGVTEGVRDGLCVVVVHRSTSQIVGQRAWT